MDPGRLQEWVENVKRLSPSISLNIGSQAITLTGPGGEQVRLVVGEFTLPGLNRAEVTWIVGKMLQLGIDKIAAEELKRREATNKEFERVSNAGTSMPTDDKVVSIHSKGPLAPRLPVF